MNDEIRAVLGYEGGLKKHIKNAAEAAFPLKEHNSSMHALQAFQALIYFMTAAVREQRAFQQRSNMNLYSHISWIMSQEVPHSTYKVLVVTGEFQVTKQLSLGDDMPKLIRLFQDDMVAIRNVHTRFEIPRSHE